MPLFNGEELLDYALTPTPSEARLIRATRFYSVMPSLNGRDDGMIVYRWRAGVKTFMYVGRRANYSAADLLIRQDIRKGRRRRARMYPAQRQPPLYIRCEYCDYIRRRSAANDGMCYDCYVNIWSNESWPDDYPAFDASTLFS